MQLIRGTKTCVIAYTCQWKDWKTRIVAEVHTGSDQQAVVIQCTLLQHCCLNYCRTQRYRHWKSSDGDVFYSTFCCSVSLPFLLRRDAGRFLGQFLGTLYLKCRYLLYDIESIVYHFGIALADVVNCSDISGLLSIRIQRARIMSIYSRARNRCRPVEFDVTLRNISRTDSCEINTCYWHGWTRVNEVSHCKKQRTRFQCSGPRTANWHELQLYVHDNTALLPLVELRAAVGSRPDRAVYKYCFVSVHNSYCHVHRCK